MLCVSTGEVLASDSCSTAEFDRIAQMRGANDDIQSGVSHLCTHLLPVALCFVVKCHEDEKADLSGQGLRCELVSLQGIQYSSPPGCAFWVTQAIMAGRWSADIEELGPLCICAQGLQLSGCYLRDAVPLSGC